MTDTQVSELIEEFRVPLHVRRHCATVAKFAVSLGEKLHAKGEKVNLALLRHAGLLHDLMRVIDFRDFHPETFPDPASKNNITYWKSLRTKYAGRGHEEVAAEILRRRGFSDVASVIEKHRYIQVTKGFNSWEEKLLYYADKRTKHDQVVSLQERLKDGRIRNVPHTIGTPEARELDEKIFALEKEILERCS